MVANADRWMKEADAFVKFCEKLAGFVSQMVHNFVFFVPVRA